MIDQSESGHGGEVYEHIRMYKSFLIAHMQEKCETKLK